MFHDVPISVPLIVAGCVVATGLAVHLLRRTFYHFARVEPGRLYRSGTLGGVGLRLVVWLFGIDTVINLRSNAENDEPWHARQRALCERLGVALVDIPMGYDEPPRPDQLEDFLSLTARSSRRVLVHCEMGIIRTGMMVLAYQHARGRPVGIEPWDWLPQFGHDIRRRRRPAFETFVERYRDAAKVD